MNELTRKPDIRLDGAAFEFSGRVRLSGKDDLSLFPSLFLLTFWNLPEELYLRLNRARTVSVSCGEAELASGTLADVCRRGSGEGILTTAAFSRGLNLWESRVSLTVPAGTSVSETVRAILEASGTGIPLLGFPAEDPAVSRPQSFFGRAAECIASAVSCAGGGGEKQHGPRAVLSPAGLTVMPPGGLPVSYTLTEQEILTAPSFVGGPLRGTPAEMILLTKPLGLHPGDTVAVRLPGLRCRGEIRERALEMDTGGEEWRCEVVTQILT